jgi:hypothetical protein
MHVPANLNLSGRISPISSMGGTDAQLRFVSGAHSCCISGHLGFSNRSTVLNAAKMLSGGEVSSRMSAVAALHRNLGSMPGILSQPVPMDQDRGGDDEDATTPYMPIVPPGMSTSAPAPQVRCTPPTALQAPIIWLRVLPLRWLGHINTAVDKEQTADTLSMQLWADAHARLNDLECVAMVGIRRWGGC